MANARKGLNNFLAFLILIGDKNPVYCFLCGAYIHPTFKKLGYAFQPFGNRGDWVEHRCYNSGITYEIANQKLSEGSLLICHIEVFKDYHPEGVCREKIQNIHPKLYEHIADVHKEIVDASQFTTELQHQFYLKPTGRKFIKPRVN